MDPNRHPCIDVFESNVPIVCNSKCSEAEKKKHGFLLGRIQLPLLENLVLLIISLTKSPLFHTHFILHSTGRLGSAYITPKS